MNLQDCLDQLARGKISNLALCENGKVKEASRAKVIDAINEALLRLYTVFPLKEKSVLVELYEGRTDYPLTSEHSWLKTLKDDRTIYDPYDYYIRDTEANPFIDDILTIMEIWDDLDRQRPLNDPDSPLGIYTPEQNLIIVKGAIAHRVLDIVYRAKHIVLTEEDLTSTVELPANLYGALFSYTAYLLHSNLNTNEAVQNSQKYLAEYQTLVNEIIQQGTLTPDKLVSDKKFIRRGFV